MKSKKLKKLMKLSRVQEFKISRFQEFKRIGWELAATCWSSPSVAVFWHEVSVVRGVIGGNGVGDSLVDAGP